MNGPEVMQIAVDDHGFGDLALRLRYLTPQQIEEALDIQDKMRNMGLIPKKLGEICVEKSWLTHEHLKSMLQIQGTRVKTQAQIPGYKVLARLGKGSMGSVYKARQISLDRIVAIKTMSPALAQDPALVARFHREARSVARLNHENVISCFEAGEAGGIHYFVMEFVNGPTLSEVLDKHGKFGEREALSIVHQVAKGLEHAHASNIIHRDLKPENVMITRQGVAKLCDLGLAKMIDTDSTLTAAGTSMGTPHYISPEQARGSDRIDGRTDIYSLGVTLFHMVCARVPFPGTNPIVVMAAHVQESPPKPRSIVPELSEGLERFILHLMQKDPADRPQNAGEVRQTVDALLRGELGGRNPSGIRSASARSGIPSRGTLAAVADEFDDKNGEVLDFDVPEEGDEDDEDAEELGEEAPRDDRRPSSRRMPVRRNPSGSHKRPAERQMPRPRRRRRLR